MRHDGVLSVYLLDVLRQNHLFTYRKIPKMKYFPIFTYLFFVLTACQSESKAARKLPAEPQKELTTKDARPEEILETPQIEAPTPPAKPKDKLVAKTATGKSFVVEKKDEKYVLNGEGFKFAKATNLSNHAPIVDVLTTDLDGNGFDEAYIIYDCQEKGDANPVIVAFVSFKDRAFGPIYVKAASAKLLKGYQGHDKIYLENGQLLREFPIYEGGQETGRLRKMKYQLSAGEAGFALEAVEM